MIKPSKGKKPIVWHPLVHQRFAEELYFFLLSAKPFYEKNIFEDLDELMNDFGVEGYCAYRIFGQYDILLRVWLPSARGPQFLDKATERIGNLQAITPFHVTSLRDRWRFKDDDFTLTLSHLSSLTAQEVKMVQDGKDPKTKEKLIQASLLCFDRRRRFC